MKIQPFMLAVLFSLIASLGCKSGPSPTKDVLQEDVPSPDVSDTNEPTPVTAVVGSRCKHGERVGVVVVSRSEGAPTQVLGEIYDKPHPWYGGPTLSTEVCDFYTFDVTGSCGVCSGGEICTRNGSCTTAPMLVTETTITLSAGSETQLIEPFSNGRLYGDLTLTGDTFAVEIQSVELWVKVPDMTVPPDLTGLESVLTGSYGFPKGLDLTWDSTSQGTFVYTLIPVNHHAGGPTYTECTVDASAGALHVGEEMLVPLAVATGLEFQGTEHVRFAAAETPRGCVEIRFSYQRYGGL